MAASFEYIALIVSVGKGVRMGGAIKKQYLDVGGIPVLSRTIQVFDSHPLISQIIVVVPKEDHLFCKESILAPFKFKHPIFLVDGGKTRQESVFNGLKAAKSIKDDNKTTMLMVHDGVRPFVSQNLLTQLMDGATPECGCIPALPMTDTIKQIDGGTVKNIDRDVLRRVQTPQVFEMEMLMEGYEYVMDNGLETSDDASVMEHLGKNVTCIDGEFQNIKITRTYDLILAEYFLEKENKKLNG